MKSKITRMPLAPNVPPMPDTAPPSTSEPDSISEIIPVLESLLLEKQKTTSVSKATNTFVTLLLGDAFGGQTEAANTYMQERQKENLTVVRALEVAIETLKRLPETVKEAENHADS